MVLAWDRDAAGKYRSTGVLPEGPQQSSKGSAGRDVQGSPFPMAPNSKTEEAPRRGAPQQEQDKPQGC